MVSTTLIPARCSLRVPLFLLGACKIIGSPSLYFRLSLLSERVILFPFGYGCFSFPLRRAINISLSFVLVSELFFFFPQIPRTDYRGHFYGSRPTHSIFLKIPAPPSLTSLFDDFPSEKLSLPPLRLLDLFCAVDVHGWLPFSILPFDIVLCSTLPGVPWMAFFLQNDCPNSPLLDLHSGLLANPCEPVVLVRSRLLPMSFDLCCAWVSTRLSATFRAL